MNSLLTRLLICLFLPGGSFAARAFAIEAPAVHLLPSAQVTGEGIYLSQIAVSNLAVALPQIRLSDAPPFGQAVILSRTELIKVMQKAAPDFVFTNWTGAERIRITRLSRTLKETELKDELTVLLQREHVRNKGDLELHFSRPWAPVAVPDEPLTFKILEMPNGGVTANFIVRFEITTTRENVGAWQATLAAKIWRETWVARSPLKTDQLFSQADVVQERRDLLTLRDTPLSITQPENTIEIAENIGAGGPIYARSVRIRPVVHRGQLVEAQLQDGTMLISLKVEVLENGAPGQVVRVRNPQSRREFRGKVQNEQTILIPL
jgi:flagella basal body P-ring formation protein FlgA